MAKLKLAYYVVKKGRGYWQPTSKMRKQGFGSICCGPDGPAAWAVAEEWNKRWQLQRRGLSPTSPSRAPRGSVSEAFDRFRQSDEWKRMAPRTQEDWERGQRLIELVFGTVNPRTIKFEHVDRFYAALLEQKGVDLAYRALKHFRRLWTRMSSMGYCEKAADPSGGIRAINPEPRSEVWTYDEVRALTKTALRMGYPGLACIIAVAWDTSLSPGDVRHLSAANLEDSGGQLTFRLRRAKTRSYALGTVSRQTERLVREYLNGVRLDSGNDILFRHRGGRPYTKDKLTADFRAIRHAVWPDDRRKLMDMRRSGAVEAAAGGVDPNALAAKMANTINSSRKLQQTYQPVNAASVDEADSARKIGRMKLKRKISY